MAKRLDFNALEQPTLELVLRDKEKTQLTLTIPSVDLIERLEANKAGISTAVKTNDTKALLKMYDLAAELMSCNEEYITVTGVDLRTKYGVTIRFLITFFQAYNEFIDEIKNAKN